MKPQLLLFLTLKSKVTNPECSKCYYDLANIYVSKVKQDDPNERLFCLRCMNKEFMSERKKNIDGVHSCFQYKTIKEELKMIQDVESKMTDTAKTNVLNDDSKGYKTSPFGKSYNWRWKPYSDENC
jgi:protein-arginine kinase activator protein McsA